MGRSTRVKTNAMKLCYLTVVKNKLFYYTFISKVPVSSWSHYLKSKIIYERFKASIF